MLKMSQAEIAYVHSHKPTFLLYKDSPEATVGLKAVKNLFCGKFGASKDYLRTLIVKHPAILGKPVSEIERDFEVLRA